MTDIAPSLADRLALRERPGASPIMYQSWGKLLFMHWQMPVDALRPHIPGRLRVDTFDGQAWVAIAPFTIWGSRPVFLPPLPWVGDFHEINVRTYVHLDGVPGVWFFSLDANSLAAVAGARTFFHLPYHNADIRLEQQGQSVVYSVSRRDGRARFDATWAVGDDLPQAEPGTLDFFLVERYCLYAADGDKLYRCRIHHQPWPLQRATLASWQSSMLEAGGLPTPAGRPLLHGAGPVSVAIWPLEEV
jgi:uncharacterized protein